MDTEEEKDYRRQYEQLRGESEQEVDNYIRYLSGGALVLSLTFIGNIVPKGNMDSSWLINLGLALLVLSLVSNFISYFVTIYSTTKTIKEIDYHTEDWMGNAISRNKPIKRIGYFAAGSTIFGIIAITLFVALNINNYG
jgi:hypothetical protein